MLSVRSLHIPRKPESLVRYFVSQFSSFSVKLDRSTITAAELAAGYVLVEVDKASDSKVKYLQPDGIGSSEVTIPLPQAKIKFTLGFSARKSISQGGDTVDIEIINLDPGSANWLEVAEYPSSLLDPRDVEDDYQFKPFGMIFTNTVVPWYITNVWRNLRPRPNEAFAFRHKMTGALTATNIHLLKMGQRLNKHLCQFWFVEDPAADLAPFWNTINHRGIYKFTRNIPPRESRHLSFHGVDATYLTQTSPGAVHLSWPVDAGETKSLAPMSKFKGAGMQNWVRVQPNPTRDRMVDHTPGPDLFTMTCFSFSDVDKFRRLLEGPPNADTWRILDSMDIKVIANAQSQPPKIGVTVNVHNCGGLEAQSVVHVTSCFLPLTGKEPAHVTPFFVGTGQRQLPSVPPMGTQTCTVWYDSLQFVDHDGTSSPLPPATLASVKRALVITLVEIDAAQGEKMLANNSAIEIVEIVLHQ